MQHFRVNMYSTNNRLSYWQTGDVPAFIDWVMFFWSRVSALAKASGSSSSQTHTICFVIATLKALHSGASTNIYKKVQLLAEPEAVPVVIPWRIYLSLSQFKSVIKVYYVFLLDWNFTFAHPTLAIDFFWSALALISWHGRVSILSAAVVLAWRCPPLTYTHHHEHIMDTMWVFKRQAEIDKHQLGVEVTPRSCFTSKPFVHFLLFFSLFLYILLFWNHIEYYNLLRDF